MPAVSRVYRSQCTARCTTSVSLYFKIGDRLDHLAYDYCCRATASFNAVLRRPQTAATRRPLPTCHATSMPLLMCGCCGLNAAGLGRTCGGYTGTRRRSVSIQILYEAATSSADGNMRADAGIGRARVGFSGYAAKGQHENRTRSCFERNLMNLPLTCVYLSPWICHLDQFDNIQTRLTSLPLPPRVLRFPRSLTCSAAMAPSPSSLLRPASSRCRSRVSATSSAGTQA
mmetsp:Transcript_109787/g.319370  ORF Transcript_109787/g.319370 Transcript_109787/m.319370 type:complete len:229 (+) Transcript_109787:1248-1934(+)